MSVGSIIDAFQTVNAGITGVTTAPSLAEYPRSLSPDKLPCAITLPGAGNPAPVGLGRKATYIRQYVVRIFGFPVSDEVGPSFDALMDVLDAAKLAYLALEDVDGHPVMRRAGEKVEDLGMTRTIAYGGIQYYAVEFRIPILEEG